MVDQKRCIPKESDFSRRMSDFFDRGMTLPFEELFNEYNTIVKRFKHANKSDYDIIQFSFVILNKEKNPLFIERKEHDITRGFSILQSGSPYTHQEGWTYPHSLDNIRWYFEQEVDSEPSDYDIDLLGIARNVRKGINYYFYVFRVDFHVETPNIFIKTEEDPLKGFRDLDSSHLLRGNKVDLLVMRALFPEFYVSQSEVEGCILHEDPDHTLRDTLFTTKEDKMTKVFISYAHEDLDASRKLYEELKSVPSIDPWFDKECLLPGMRWRPAIRKVIRESKIFIALLSKRSTTKRGFFHKEMKDALSILEEFPEDQIFFIPIRLEECNLSFESLKEIQYVDFFPNWGEGLKKVLNVINPVPQVNANRESVVSTGYVYRCGIVDLDIGITNCLQIAQRLNSIQKFFHFTCPSIFLSPNAVRSIEGSPNLAVHLLPQSLYEQKEYLNVDLVACLTKYPLAFKSGNYIKFNYFSGPSGVDDRFMFISTHSLYDFTKQANCSFEKGIVYLILSQLLVYFTDLGYHDETRGCVMDFSEIRSDMIKGLKEMKCCPECLEGIEDENLKEAVQAILADEMKI